VSKLEAYNYANKDLLEYPQKYQMTPFSGVSFLQAYNKFRNGVLEFLNEKKIPDYSLKDICKKINSTIEENYLIKLENEVVIQKLFTKILYLQITKSSNSELIRILDIFVRRFEVKKRLFTTYDSDLKQKSDNYSVLLNYLLFSILCLLRYENTLNLKYLNTSLKLNDILCSQINKINDYNEIILLKLILEKEIVCVANLCRLKGIKVK